MQCLCTYLLVYVRLFVRVSVGLHARSCYHIVYCLLIRLFAFMCFCSGDPIVSCGFSRCETRTSQFYSCGHSGLLQLWDIDTLKQHLEPPQVPPRLPVAAAQQAVTAERKAHDKPSWSEEASEQSTGTVPHLNHRGDRDDDVLPLTRIPLPQPHPRISPTHATAPVFSDSGASASHAHGNNAGGFLPPTDAAASPSLSASASWSAPTLSSAAAQAAVAPVTLNTSESQCGER